MSHTQKSIIQQIDSRKFNILLTRENLLQEEKLVYEIIIIKYLNDFFEINSTFVEK